MVEVAGIDPAVIFKAIVALVLFRLFFLFVVLDLFVLLTSNEKGSAAGTAQSHRASRSGAVP